MKCKVFDQSDWTRAGCHEQTTAQHPECVVADFRAGKVLRPLDVPGFEQTFRILDTGYRWPRIHPHGAGEGVMGHALTLQVNAQGVPVQLYIDIHGGEGVTASGLPWHDDLYLDVLARVDPQSWRVIDTELIDQDELQEAHEAGLVTADLLAGTFAPLLFARALLTSASSTEISAPRH